MENSERVGFNTPKALNTIAEGCATLYHRKIIIKIGNPERVQ
jgi:hypothetical protein